MIRLGITGGVGMGKSMASKLLYERGFKVTDSDEIARALVEPGKPALEEIVKAFGPEVLMDNGGLNRKKVSELVFSDTSKRITLEGILHPVIRKIWQHSLNVWAAQNEKLGVVVLPLLYEKAYEMHFDKVVCIACSEEVQRDRLCQRGWSDLEIDRRIKAQLLTEEKKRRADYVVWTDGPIDKHAKQWDELVSYLFVGSEVDD
ncbi:MAG: dephospho-CoA kinase [Verrucomicrobiales bacterium]|nr:dephospho-CoA kinase [Verrucomicrobiales bacterium]